MVKVDDVKTGNGGELAEGFGLCADGSAHPAEAAGVALVGGASPHEYAAQMDAIRERIAAEAPEANVSVMEWRAA